MNAKSAINKEIFAPHDERMLGAVQVKRRTKKKIPFLATGGQGEYLTYICLSVIKHNCCLQKESGAGLCQLKIRKILQTQTSFLSVL
uniref:Syntaxin binding protein 6 n=1 Tax=Gallus gallus TaxID=9031 RepID=A0A8V0XPB3_CHICK